MGGAGPAFGPDGSGNNWIYVTTANGTFDQTTNWGDSFLKLDPSTLTIPASNGYLTPNDQLYRSSTQTINGKTCSGDVDFGSGGVTLIPDGELTYPGYSHMAVTGEKEGYLWFIRRDLPGQFNGYNDCTPGGGGPNVQTYAVNSQLSQVIHTSIAFWDSESGQFPGKPFVYVSPQNAKGNGYPNYLYQFTLCTLGTDSSPICGSTPSAQATLACCTNGITPTISAAPQATEAIVWALDKTDGGCSEQSLGPSCPTKPNGILYAFDAVSLAQLYSSSTCQAGVDMINQATKFSVPTVANGYVYLGTQSNNSNSPGKGTFYIFGPLSRSGC